MKFRVVICDCGNPELHRKLEDECGGRTEGVFCLRQGMAILDALEKKGSISLDEAALAYIELVAAGLPEYATVFNWEVEEVAPVGTIHTW